jgi:hypothetical protein
MLVPAAKAAVSYPLRVFHSPELIPSGSVGSLILDREAQQ